MPLDLPRPTIPGLFITATDTGVGKTVVTCAIARALRQQLSADSAHGKANTVGVLKPLASGCRGDREGWVSQDAEALAHFADCRLPLSTICPIRYAPPLAPAQAAEHTGTPPNYAALSKAIDTLDQHCNTLLVEGLGGLLAPLDDRLTVLDLIRALGYPVVVVTRPDLGTLNHTALTVRVLRKARCRIAGIVINRYDPDSPDSSVGPNRLWLAKMNNLPILATIPACDQSTVEPHHAKIPAAVLDAVGATYWPDVLGAARSPINGT